MKSLVAEFIVVLVTARDRAEAVRISEVLLEKKLIACANIVGAVASCFLWQGRIDRVEECLIVMKSRRDLFAQLVVVVKGLHSYEVPEVLALPIVEGAADYLAWMGSVLRDG